MKDNRISENALKWLKNNGGYCDCEVLANIQYIADSLNNDSETSTPFLENLKKELKEKKKPNIQSLNKDFSTSFGLTIKVQKPWKIKEYTEEENSLFKFSFGKGDDFEIILFENDVSAKLNDEEYWINQYEELSEMDNDEDFSIAQILTEVNAKNYNYLEVKQEPWTLVYIWLISVDYPFYLRIKTNIQRRVNDVKEVQKLFNSFNFPS